MLVRGIQEAEVGLRNHLVDRILYSIRQANGYLEFSARLGGGVGRVAVEIILIRHRHISLVRENEPVLRFPLPSIPDTVFGRLFLLQQRLLQTVLLMKLGHDDFRVIERVQIGEPDMFRLVFQ